MSADNENGGGGEVGAGEEYREITKPDGLDAVAAEAAKFDAAGVAVIEPEAGKEPEIPAKSSAELASSAGEWRDAVEFGCGIVIEIEPELAEEWTEERQEKLAAALAKAGAHYGWTVEKLLGHPLVGLAFAAYPMGKGLVRVARKKAAISGNPQPEQT